MKSKLQIMVFSIATLAIAAHSRASLVEFVGMGLNRNVNIFYDGDSSYVSAGKILINNGADLTAFCVDLDHKIKNQWTADVAPVDSISGGLAAAYLYDQFNDGVDTGTKAAALQIAIWEVVSDFSSALDLTDGLFRLIDSNDVRSQAESYLAALPQNLNNYVTPSYLIKSGPSPRSQDLIVPEPATLGVIGMGLPVFLIRRRVLPEGVLN